MKDDNCKPNLKSSKYSKSVPTNAPIFFDLYPNADNLSVSFAWTPNFIDLSVLLKFGFFTLKLPSILSEPKLN